VGLEMVVSSESLVALCAFERFLFKKFKKFINNFNKKIKNIFTIFLQYFNKFHKILILPLQCEFFRDSEERVCIQTNDCKLYM
jgi:hypothetical protein